MDFYVKAIMFCFSRVRWANVWLLWEYIAESYDCQSITNTSASAIL